ncbi:MAG: D-alanine--D-alanine ligase [Candidatus Paceibacterota bacterium]
MSQYRTAVMRGGPSDEHLVSMQTGRSVIDALLDTQFQPIDITISRQGEWLVDGFVRTPEAALSAIDVVFIALHGSYGEDGTVQRLLDRLGVPYTGSGAFASNRAMNKVLTKEFLKPLGIKTPRYMKVSRDVTDVARLVDSISGLFGDRYVVKPVDGGSSIATTMVKGNAELLHTIQHMLQERPAVLVEEQIIGKEATVGVIDTLRGQSHYHLPAVEIVPPSEAAFFDYENKYNGQTEEICPGRFSIEEKRELGDIARTVHAAMELSQYSRSDFMIAPTGIFFLEVNTLPGLTPQSLFPKALDAVGMSYRDFLLHLLSNALERRSKRLGALSV